MDHKISKAARDELLEALRNRYRLASRKEKALIRDELVALAQCHRKRAHATRARRFERRSCSAGWFVRKGLHSMTPKPRLHLRG
jgi:hypothetical protein